MEFDKSKVFTAFNAEELKIGSKCIFANSVDSLESQVEADSYSTYIQRLDQVMGKSSTNRFKSGDKTYNLAYFISERDLLKWTDLKVGDIIVTRRRVVDVDKSDITRMHIKMDAINDSVSDEWITDEDLAFNWEKEEPLVSRFRNANLNEHIKVKLTARGKEIYRSYYDNDPPTLDYDDDGYAKFQMWDFMRIFGPHMNMGLGLVCETNVKIEVKE